MRNETLYICAAILLAAVLIAVSSRARPIVIEFPTAARLTIEHKLILPVKPKEGGAQ